MEFIVDWNAVCLVCLQEGKMRSLRDKDSIGILLSEKIIKCANISIYGTNFPEQICVVCEMDLEAAYRFKINAESSNAILKSLLDSQIQSKSVVRKENVDQLIYNAGSIRRNNTNDIKLEEMPNDVQELNAIQASSPCAYDPTSLKLMNKEDLQSESFDPIAVNYNQILPEKLIPPIEEKQEKNIVIGKFCYQRQKRKHCKDEFVDKQVTEEIVEVSTKGKNSNKPLKICEICGNSYKYQNALDSHMRRHRNEKPFSCEFCQRSFVANVELRRHMRVHTGQKPYTCQFCPRAFSDFGSRGKHERTHTGERPYACETCGKTFAYAHVLQVHILTHTGEKKYKCSICGKGFTKKLYLISHTSNSHK